MNNRLISIFLISRVASSLGDQLLMFAIPLIVYTLTESIALSGFVMFAEWLPRVLSLPIAGSLNDRFGGWRIYIIADSIRGLACILAFGLCVFAAVNQFTVIAVLAAVCAFFYAQAFVSLESTIPLLVNKQSIPKAQSILQAIDQSTMIGGPALGGICVIWLAPISLLFVAGALFLISLSLTTLLIPYLKSEFSKVVRNFSKNVFVDIKTGLNEIRQTPILWKLILLSVGVNGMVGLALATGAALTLGEFHQKNSSFGILQVAVGIFSIITLLFVPKLLLKFNLLKLAIFSYFGIVIGGVLMGVAPHFILFVLGFGLVNGLCGLFNIYIRTERLNWIKKENLGKTLSLIVMFNQLSLPIAGLVVAYTAGHFHTQYLFLIMAILSTSIFFYLFTGLKKQSLSI